MMRHFVSNGRTKSKAEDRQGEAYGGGMVVVFNGGLVLLYLNLLSGVWWVTWRYRWPQLARATKGNWIHIQR